MKTSLALITSLGIALSSSLAQADEAELLPGPTSALKAWPAAAVVRGDASVTDDGIMLELATGSSPWRAVLRSPEASFGLDRGPLVIEVSGILYGGLPGEQGSNDLFILVGNNSKSTNAQDFYPLALTDGASFNIIRKRQGYELFVYPGRADKVGEQRYYLSAVPTAFTLTLDRAKGTWTMKVVDALFIDEDSDEVSGDLPRSVMQLADGNTYLALGVLNWGAVDEGTTATLGKVKVTRKSD